MATFDYVVHKKLSPRIIEITTATDITVQELVDMCREWEDSAEGMNFPYLIDAAGKESLGGGVTVGITATLQNAQVMFTGRTTPLDPGTGRTCDATDPAGIQLYVDDADFVTLGVCKGDTVFNASTAEMAAVTDIVDANTLATFPLTGGAGEGWTVGDNYAVYHNEPCSITGGNLVAVDISGDPMTATFSTPNIFLKTTSSSSATLSELDAIQYASYGGGVSLDINSTNSGTNYPTGNVEYPVNNLTDAVSIANIKGFRVLFIRSSMTGVNALDSGTDISNFMLMGESSTNTAVEIATSAISNNIRIKNCDVTGVLDGGTHLSACTVGDISYMNGYIENCGLYGTISLDGDEDAVLSNCYIVDVATTPVIDLGGEGQDVIVVDWSGQIKFQNMTGDNRVSVQIDGGKVILDSTISAGYVGINGIGQLEDNSTGTATVHIGGLINREQITTPSWTEVCIDVVNGEAGTAFPLGLMSNPVNNITDARTIAVNNNIEVFHLHSDITLNDSFEGYSFFAHSPSVVTIDLNNQLITGAIFENVTLAGVSNGRIGEAHNCILSDGMTGVDGIFVDCYCLGSLTQAAAGANIIMRRATAGGMAGGILDVVGSDRLIGATNLSGEWTIKNMASGSPPSIVSLGFDSGKLTIDSSCTGGFITISGTVHVVDNSGAGCIVTSDSQISTSSIVDAVWDEAISDHLIEFSTGEALQDGASGGTGLDAAQTAAAVWNADPDNYKTAGTFGQWFRKTFWGSKTNT